MSDLKNKFGQNVSWFCLEGSITLADTLDKGTINSDFDVYGENEDGVEGSCSIDVIELLESAHAVIEEQSTELTTLRQQNSELVELTKINNQIFKEIAKDLITGPIKIHERTICFDAMLVGEALLSEIKGEQDA